MESNNGFEVFTLMSFIHLTYLLSNYYDKGTGINFLDAGSGSLKQTIHYFFSFQTDNDPNAVLTPTT